MIFLADRIPFSAPVEILFQLAKNKEIKIYISAISINNTYYILRKVTSHKRAINLISEIEQYVIIQETNREIIRRSLQSQFNDFEDAIQYYSAVALSNIDIIVTRNIKDFKRSDLPVLSPETTIKMLL